jgi:hypothetical protein
MQEFYKMIFKGKPIFKERKVFSKPFSKNLLKNCWQGQQPRDSLIREYQPGTTWPSPSPERDETKLMGTDMSSPELSLLTVSTLRISVFPNGRVFE